MNKFFKLKLNKILTTIGAAICTSLLGIELSIIPAAAQSSRPYIVLVNGWQNCCAWGIADRFPSINADIRYVPYSNFNDGGRSGNTSTDEQFLRDGADYINNQLDRNRPLILIGHSFGGDSVLKLLPRINRRIQFVAVIDPVSTGGFRAPLTRSLAVGNNVDYFFNRWQENVPFPNDFKANGSIPCNAARCDQEAQNIARNADSSPVTRECRWDEVTCPGFVAPTLTRRGRKGRKQVRVSHQDLPRDAYIQKTLGDKISGVLASFRPESIASSSQNTATAIVSTGGLCLDAKDYGESRVGNPLHLWNCNGEPAQRWQFTQNGQIVSAGGLCLDAKDYGESRVGNPLHLWNCNGEPAQRWQFTQNGQIVSAGRLCLDAKDYGESRVGNPLHLWNCNGEPAQRWSRK